MLARARALSGSGIDGSNLPPPLHLPLIFPDFLTLAEKALVLDLKPSGFAEIFGSTRYCTNVFLFFSFFLGILPTPRHGPWMALYQGMFSDLILFQCDAHHPPEPECKSFSGAATCIDTSSWAVPITQCQINSYAQSILSPLAFDPGVTPRPSHMATATIRPNRPKQ